MLTRKEPFLGALPPRVAQAFLFPETKSYDATEDIREKMRRQLLLAGACLPLANGRELLT